MKNRLPWVLAVIILCTAVLILSPKNVNADDEYPKITFSIDFGAGHEAFVQEINLQVERPALHILIKICEIGGVVNRFKTGSPFEVLAE